MKLIAGIFENDDIAAFYLSLGQERKVRAAAGCKDKFVYQQVIADQDGVLH